MAFFIAQLTRASKGLFLSPTPQGAEAQKSFDLMVRWVMKNAFLPPRALGGWASKRFSSPW